MRKASRGDRRVPILRVSGMGEREGQEQKSKLHDKTLAGGKARMLPVVLHGGKPVDRRLLGPSRLVVLLGRLRNSRLRRGSLQGLWPFQREPRCSHKWVSGAGRPGGLG